MRMFLRSWCRSDACVSSLTGPRDSGCCTVAEILQVRDEELDEEFYDCNQDADIDTEGSAPDESNIFELNAMDLRAAPSSPALDGLEEREPWTVDSGASQSVASRKAFPEAVVVESPGSKSGQIYKGPGKEIIKNEGQMDVMAMVEPGTKAKITFQTAEVRRPLVAVSSLSEKGNLTLFDDHGSFIIPGSAPEVELIRQLVAQIGGKIPLYKEKGVYKVRNWAPAGNAKASTFARQGK